MGLYSYTSFHFLSFPLILITTLRIILRRETQLHGHLHTRHSTIERNAGEFIYAIPQTSRNTIAYLIEMIMVNIEFYELTNLFLNTLTVTEVSLVTHLLEISNNFLDFEKYINSLREIDPTIQLMNTVV